MTLQSVQHILARAAAFLGFAALAVFPVQAQKFGFDVGVKGGTSFTDLIDDTGVFDGTSFSDLSRSSEFLIGPAAEITIPFGFAVEVDGLYHRSEYTATLPAPLPPGSLNSTAWELPYLAKFRFPVPLVKPFILGGGVYRTFTDLSPEVSAAKNGLVLGGGLELKVSKLRLSGELRYIHWAAPSDLAPVKGNQNQGEILFGVMF
jgi:hypothetical protein